VFKPPPEIAEEWQRQHAQDQQSRLQELQDAVAERRMPNLLPAAAAAVAAVAAPAAKAAADAAQQGRKERRRGRRAAAAAEAAGAAAQLRPAVADDRSSSS
jgi:hypothetical protein